MSAVIYRLLGAIGVVSAIASCGPQIGDASRERLVGKWAAEQINRDERRTFILLNNADGSFEMDERTEVAGGTPKTLVWKGKWLVEDGHYKLQMLALNGNPLGTAHPVRHQSFKIVESTASMLVLLHDDYETIGRFDKTGTLKDDYTYRYAKTD